MYLYSWRYCWYKYLKEIVKHDIPTAGRWCKFTNEKGRRYSYQYEHGSQGRYTHGKVSSNAKSPVGRSHTSIPTGPISFVYTYTDKAFTYGKITVGIAYFTIGIGLSDLYQRI